MCVQRSQVKAPLRRLLRGVVWTCGLSFVGSLIVLAGAGPRTSPIPAATVELRSESSRAMSDWSETLDDLFDDVEGSAGESQGIIETAMGADLDPASKAVIDANLDLILARIDQVLDGNREPSLTPVDAGTIDTTIQPATALDYADAVVALTREARAELDEEGDDADDAYLGTRLKTIEHLITRSVPHNYRVLVGLE